MKFKVTLFLLVCALIPIGTCAQTACPPGMEEYGAGVCGYSQSEQPGQSAQQVPQMQQPGPKWLDNWGAIATYEPNGSLGTSVDLPTQSSAENMALKDCKSKHGSECKIQLSYRNQCAAMVVGGKFFNVQSGATLEEAVRTGMKLCGPTAADCHVYYKACSLPVRVQ